MAKTITEDFEVPGHDAGSSNTPPGGVHLPDPVATGDVHANRAADQVTNDSQAVDVPGVGTVSHAEMLRALLSKLAGLPSEVLARIADDLDPAEGEDFNENPSAATDGLQAGNLASISVKEEMDEIFAGSDLTEEFKTKTAVIFEAALGARLVVLEAELEEKNQVKIQEAVESVTEQMVEQIDRYLSFTAEQYIEENKVAIEATVRSTVAEEFLNGVIALARQYNIDLPETQVDVVEALSNQVEALETKLNEALDREIDLTSKIKGFEKAEILDSVSEGLTLTQKERLKILIESVDTSDVEEFKSKVGILRESVANAASEAKSAVEAKTAVLTESVHNGVPVLSEKVEEPVRTPEMQRIIEAMRRVETK